MFRILILLLFPAFSLLAQGVIISNQDTLVDPSAMLEIKSIDKGFLPPRMTTANRMNLSNPAEGLLLFDLDEHMYFYRSDGQWQSIDWSPSILSDADDDTKIQVEESPDEDQIRFDIEDDEMFRLDRTSNQRFRFNLATNGFNVLLGTNVAENGIGARNVLIGHESGEMASNFADDNILLGRWAGRNLTGDNCIMIGSNSGLLNTSGANNTFVGYSTGNNNTTGHNNTAIGYVSGESLTTSFRNTFLGSRAGTNVTTGGENVMLGSGSGWHTTTGSTNVFIGDDAGHGNRTGNQNTVIGNESGGNNLNGVDMGSNNTFLGHRSGYRTNGSSHNTFLGSQAGEFAVSGSNNTFVGDHAGHFTNSGAHNTFVGVDAGRGNNTGENNTFLGSIAGFANYNGSDNIAFGQLSLRHNYDGNFNIAIGSNALSSNEHGSNNVAIGNGALTTSTGDDYTQNNNVAIGLSAGSGEQGNDNVYIGTQTGSRSSFSTGNTFIGALAGQDPILGNGVNNTLLGYDSKILFAPGVINNSTALGTGASILTSNTIVIGDHSNEPLNTGIGTNNPGAKLHVNSNQSGKIFRVSAQNADKIALWDHGGVSIGSGNSTHVYHNGLHVLANTRIGSYSQFADYSQYALGVDGDVEITDDLTVRDQVLIGYDDNSTLNSSYKMAVKGWAVFEEVWVRNPLDNWPDYVFKSDYKLRSLSELEKHINTHGHLPNVPSAVEVAKEGNHLGETQRILLEKIEELTLYIIELDKKVEAQSKELKALKSK